MVSAESHPAWWRLVSPEATALVGLDWEHLKSSPFGEAIQDELSGDGGLGFPQMDCLREARQILISSPALLAVAAGSFPAERLRQEAEQRGIRRAVYHEAEVWITPGKETLSIARLSDDLILVGHVKELQAAIDRSQSEDPKYSPLLARAARYAKDDFWVVTDRLPDPLANRFVPIEAEAEAFEGSISLQGGLRLSARLKTSSPDDAADVADSLKQTIASLPPVAQEIQVTVDQASVSLSLGLTPVQYLAALRTSSGRASVTEMAVKPEPPSKPAGPQVIRIYGLDDGPRQIVLR
jgi:hypothetical protein